MTFDLLSFALGMMTVFAIVIVAFLISDIHIHNKKKFKREVQKEVKRRMKQ